MRTKPITLIFCLLLGSGLNARADYDAANAALQKKDYATALPLLEEAAALNDPRATNALGDVYLNGHGVVKDEVRALQWYEKAAKAGNTLAMNMLATAHVLEKYSAPRDMLKARAWAERSAQSGNHEGQSLYYITVKAGPELNYKDPAGKTDEKRYALLAGRSMSERELDQKAHVMLALSATQGNLAARALVIGFLLEKSGPGNSERALALINEAPPEIANMFQTTKQALLRLRPYGESYTSFITFSDTMKAALPVAMQQGKLVVGETCEPVKSTKITKFRVSRPLTDAQYLPVDVRILKDTYLVKGNWNELWQFQVCGIDVAVPIAFQADGLGGTKFQLTGCVLPNPTPSQVSVAPTDCASQKTALDITFRMNEKGDFVQE